MVVLFAKDFLDQSQVIVRSAENLASAVVANLHGQDQVGIAMDGMPPVSSSFFNVVLRSIVETFGPQGLDRIQMVSVSPILRDVFQRSLIAARQLAV